MYDLIDESGKELERYGYRTERLSSFGITRSFLIVDSEEKSKDVGLDIGEYYIFNCPELYFAGIECEEYLSSVLAKQFKEMLIKVGYDKSSKLLLLCLGNPDIASDRLGKEVFDNVQINALSDKNNIYKFCPNIFFSTGIEKIDMVKMLVDGMNVDIVIIIDSLTTNSLNRLGTSFQLTTSGMTPGSGVNRFGKRICKESIQVPCISWGIP